MLELLDLRDRRSGSSPGASRSTLTYPPSFARSSAMFDDENDELFELTLHFCGSDLRERACSSPPGSSGPPSTRSRRARRALDGRPIAPPTCTAPRSQPSARTSEGTSGSRERVRPNRAPARGSATQARPSGIVHAGALQRPRGRLERRPADGGHRGRGDRPQRGLGGHARTVEVRTDERRAVS